MRPDAKVKTLSCEIDTANIVFLYLLSLLCEPETRERSMSKFNRCTFLNTCGQCAIRRKRHGESYRFEIVLDIAAQIQIIA